MKNGVTRYWGSLILPSNSGHVTKWVNSQARGDSYEKTSINHQKATQAAQPEFRQEALKLAERIGVAATVRELNLYESQLYNWRSKQQNQLSSSDREQAMPAEIAHLKRPLAEGDEELAILQKAAAYFAKRLKWSMSSSKNIRLNSVSKPCAVYFRLPVVAGTSGISVVIR